MHNPYEPTVQVTDSSPATTATALGVFETGVCWLLVFVGVLLMIGSLLLIGGNGYYWLVEPRPGPIKALMLFVILSIGVIPGILGFALQHYSRRFLRWRSTKARATWANSPGGADSQRLQNH